MGLAGLSQSSYFQIHKNKRWSDRTSWTPSSEFVPSNNNWEIQNITISIQWSINTSNCKHCRRDNGIILMSKLQIHKIWMNRHHEKDLKLPRATVYLIIQIVQKSTGTDRSKCPKVTNSFTSFWWWRPCVPFHFVGLAYQGKDIVFRFIIIEYNNLSDIWKMIFWFVLKLEISYLEVMISWRILVSFRGLFWRIYFWVLLTPLYGGWTINLAFDEQNFPLLTIDDSYCAPNLPQIATPRHSHPFLKDERSQDSMTNFYLMPGWPNKCTTTTSFTDL